RSSIIGQPVAPVGWVRRAPNVLQSGDEVNLNNMTTTADLSSRRSEASVGIYYPCSVAFVERVDRRSRHALAALAPAG
ncbi:MAG: hypothetical protein ABI969_14720, partial [bacterium]